jgi:mannose-1-phosphate guanylyltransferase
MRAVVLVGGFGTRLRPLTNATPKQMLPIVDRPMIEWVVAHLAQHGIDDVVLSLGYRPDAFAAAYPDGTCAGVRLHYAVEPAPLDTAGAIAFAARHAGISERFVAVNGDVLTDLDIGALVRFHDARGAEGSISLHRVDDPSRFGVVATDDSGRVVAFVEKPPRDEAPSDRINGGTYVLEPSVLDRIPADRPVSIERETFPMLVDDGTLYAVDDGDAFWIDTGTPAQYLEAQLALSEGGWQHPSATVAPAARVERSIVGAGVAIDAGAVVERSALLPGARVGADAVVVDSILGPGATVGTGARLDGGVVLGDGVVVEAGAHLSGVRVPEPA